MPSEADLIRAVCERTPEAPSAVARRGHGGGGLRAERIPPDLDRIVLKAMRKEPEWRYGSVDEFSADVGRFLDGQPVLAASDSMAYRARKFVRRHRVAVFGAVAVVAAVAAGTGATVWQARVAREERGRAERQFNAVRTLAQSVLGELYDSVSGLRGSLPAREILLRRVTQYLDTLAREAGDSVGLRREVVDGYMRLGQLQGLYGMENLGDRSAATRSYQSAAAILEPLVGQREPDPRDALTLADVLVRLEMLSAGGAEGPNVRRARGLIESLPADVRASRRAGDIEGALWSHIADQQVAAKDYAAARISYGNQMRAAEAVWRLNPKDNDASRNLSLACKQLGAVLQVQQSRTEARALFEKALALDRERVERDPAKGLWRLDLSFSLGSIGALLQGQGDLDGAIAHYEQAVELRRAVVAAEPADEFARVSLARGYQRLALIETERGRTAEALGWHRRRAELYLAELNARPERDSAWWEYVQTAFESVSSSLDLIEAAPPGSRQAHLAGAPGNDRRAHGHEDALEG